MTGRAKRMALGLSAALFLASTGCVLVGPATVRHDVTQATGLDLDREFGLRLGRVSMFFVRHGVKAVDDEVGLDGVRKVAIGVYQVRGQSDDRLLCRADLSDWEPVVRICDREESALMFVRERDGQLRGVLIVARDGDELVIVRARGRLDRLVEAALDDVDVCDDASAAGCARREEARAGVLEAADALGG